LFGVRAAFFPLAGPRGPRGPSGCAAARPPRGRTGHGHARLQDKDQQVAAAGAAEGLQKGDVRPGVRPGAGRVQPVVQPCGAEQELQRTGVRPAGASGRGARLQGRAAPRTLKGASPHSLRAAEPRVNSRTGGAGETLASHTNTRARPGWYCARTAVVVASTQARDSSASHQRPTACAARGLQWGRRRAAAAGRGPRGRRAHRLQQGRAVVQYVGRPGVVHSVGTAGHQRSPRRGQARGEAVQVQGRIPAGARELDQGGGQCGRAGQPGLHRAAERSVCARGLTFWQLRGRPCRGRGPRPRRRGKSQTCTASASA